MENLNTFETGKIYKNNYICDSNLYAFFKIIKRTEKTVWAQRLIYGKNDGPVIRRKIDLYHDKENFAPDGKYSMSLTIYADPKRIVEEKTENGNWSD